MLGVEALDWRAEETGDVKAVVVSLGEGHRVGNIEFLARSADTPRFNLALIEIQPYSGGPPPHQHAAEDDAFYILAGELTFGVEGEGRSSLARARSCSCRLGSSTRSRTAATQLRGWSTSTPRPASTSGWKRIESTDWSQLTKDRPREGRKIVRAADPEPWRAAYAHSMATLEHAEFPRPGILATRPPGVEPSHGSVRGLERS